MEEGKFIKLVDTKNAPSQLLEHKLDFAQNLPEAEDAFRSRFRHSVMLVFSWACVLPRYTLQGNTLVRYVKYSFLFTVIQKVPRRYRLSSQLYFSNYRLWFI